MAIIIGSVTDGNANADEIRNNSPDSEVYEKGKKYLQGSLVKSGDKIYLAKRNVPSDVDLDNPYYWEIFIDAADSKRVDEILEQIGNLNNLETESKDTLVAAINEAAQTGGSGSGGGYKIGDGLKLDKTTNTLSVDVANVAEEDNTKPITSAAVHVEIGNINALLATI